MLTKHIRTATLIIPDVDKTHTNSGSNNANAIPGQSVQDSYVFMEVALKCASLVYT